MQNSCFAVSARWEPIYVQAICSGQGFSGAATALAPLLVSLFADENSRADPGAINKRALIVFVFCGLVIMLSFMAYIVLRRLDIYKYYMQNKESNEWGFERQPLRIEGREMLRVAYKIGDLVFANMWVWVVSLSLFPAVTGGVTSIEGPGQFYGIWGSKVIFSGLHYLVYNCGDWLGRVLTGFNLFTLRNTKAIAAIALLRTAFIPLFIMCNSETPQNGNRAIPTLIASDAGFFTVLVLFAMSNGWTSSLAFMQAPQKADGTQEEEVSGVVQSFAMSFGSTLGSMCGFAVRGVVCKCNPFIS